MKPSPPLGCEPQHRDSRNTTKPWALVADIGGTRARFARCDLDGSHLHTLLEDRTANFATVTAAIKRALTGTLRAPTIVNLAVAAPVKDGAAQLTNAHWSFSLDDVRTATSTENVRLLNDFEALARVLPRLSPQDVHVLKRGNADRSASCVILGPGTGLGAAGYIRSRDRWDALPSEGGHMTYGATDERERAVHALLAAKYGHVSWERVVSGPGLLDGFEILGGTGAAEPAHVVALAREGIPAAREAIDFFADALARFAADATLMLRATGGVYIAGGIVPRILDLIDEDRFCAAFAQKGRMAAYLAAVPVFIVTAADAGLRGAAAGVADLVHEGDRVGWAHV